MNRVPQGMQNYGSAINICCKRKGYINKAKNDEVVTSQLLVAKGIGLSLAALFYYIKDFLCSRKP